MNSCIFFQGCLHFGRGETNNSVVVSVINKGYSMLKIWDDKVPHKPTDYVKIHTGDIIFPVNVSKLPLFPTITFSMNV